MCSELTQMFTTERLVYSAAMKASCHLPELFWLLTSVPSYIYLFCHLSSYFFYGVTALSGPKPPRYRGFTITHRHSTLSRTPLDEWSVRRRELYLTTHNTHNRQTFMPLARLLILIPGYLLTRKTSKSVCNSFFKTFGNMPPILSHRYTEDFWTTIISELEKHWTRQRSGKVW
jgi:hypothetical protein